MIDRFNRFKNRYYKPVVRIILFILSIVCVTYLLPKTSKFGYEYSKGTPWKHKLLIAPTDFPIYKTSKELSHESDSLMQYFRPYFTKDSSQLTTVLHLLNKDLEKNRDLILTKHKALFKHRRKPSFSYEQLQSGLNLSIKSIYDKGIILLPEKYINAPSTFEFMLVEGSYSEPYQLADLNLQTQAYQNLSTLILTAMVDTTSKFTANLKLLLTDLELNKYIHPNVNYDAERSLLEEENMLQNISLTAGRVLAGQRIIDEGEIVKPSTEKVLDSLKRDYESKLASSSNYYQIIASQALIITLLFIIIYLFLFYFRKDVYSHISHISFILLITLMMISLSSFTIVFKGFPFYILPFAILPIIIRTFFDSRLAFFMHTITVLISAFFADNSFQFVFIQVPAGLVAIFSLVNMVRRSHIVRAAILITLTYSLFYTGFAVWSEGDITQVMPLQYAIFAANGVLLLLVYPLIYIFERLFGFVSDVTLVELSDTNHPILRKLAEAAPGTFQHSIQVGNLAQEVAYKLDANPALVRAGAMYHDIGKMASPLYFTENQTSGLNLHSKLEFEQSARIVIDHIENGVKLANKNKLPKQIIDFITTHQGTTKTWFFYNSFINKNPEATVDVSAFSYPGPTPFTKETAILMMADSIEAASRSLKSYNDDEIDKIVEKIVNTQISEDQFINAPITFKEITIAKDVFKTKLKNIYHARIEYPDIKKKK